MNPASRISAAIRAADVNRCATAGAAATGIVMLVLPALTAPAAAQAITAAGLLAVAISLINHRPPAGTLAAVAAIAQCVVTRPATLLIAPDGLLILGYLLLVDAPRHAPPGPVRRWLCVQVPGMMAAVLVSGAVLAAVALPAASSVWIALAGVAAAVAAYLIAIPGQRRPPA